MQDFNEKRSKYCFLAINYAWEHGTVIWLALLRDDVHAKKVTKLWTLSVASFRPPPRIYGHLAKGGLFSKSAYWRLVTIAKKTHRFPYFGELIFSRGN